VKSKTSISSVRVKNFKAIQDSGTVSLSALTVFIGNNGAGKSSLMEAAEAYQTVVTDGLEKAMQKWLGFDYIWNRGRRHNRQSVGTEAETYENPMHFSLRGTLLGGAFSSRMTLSADPGINGMRIEEERIKLREGRLYERNREGVVNISRNGKAESKAIFHPFETAAPVDMQLIVRDWQFLAMHPDIMGLPIVPQLTRAGIKLNRDGSNLGQYLWDLRERDLSAFNGLIETFRYILPYARDVQSEVIDAVQRTVYLQMTEGEFKVQGWLMSTGTVRLLALLALLRHPNPAPIIFVEEIENGLDPRTIHLIVDEIKAANEAGIQVVATTHSPYLLDLLPLESIVLVDRIDGSPHFIRPASDKDVRAWAKEFSPGQLYTMSRLNSRRGK